MDNKVAMTADIKLVNCPTCQNSVEWTEQNTFRPFCSKRCQLIDFSDWANEKNRLPSEDPPDFDIED